MVDACGNALDFIITGGQVHAVKVAPKFIKQNEQRLVNIEVLSADKGYDCDKFKRVNQTNRYTT